jgi:hypothetical protein
MFKLPLSIKKTALALIPLALAATLSIAAEPSDDAKKDIARHRTIAAAHEAAAKCLESGKDEDVCHAALAPACKGIAIGKYCGMKHEH